MPALDPQSELRNSKAWNGPMRSPAALGGVSFNVTCGGWAAKGISQVPATASPCLSSGCGSLLLISNHQRSQIVRAGSVLRLSEGIYRRGVELFVVDKLGIFFELEISEGIRPIGQVMFPNLFQSLAQAPPFKDKQYRYATPP